MSHPAHPEGSSRRSGNQDPSASTLGDQEKHCYAHRVRETGQVLGWFVD